MTSVIHAQLQAVIDDLSNRFAERRSVVRVLAAAFVAGEHVLLLGPPGTAKTDLVRATAQAFVGAGEFFPVLATKFSTMEDMFGPVDVQAMKAGQYKRIVNGRAWDRKVVLVDEIFKGSSSILNSLLKLMQERSADNGGEVDCPLEVMVGCSNEYPESDVLAALYDRFAFKCWVDYVADPSALRRVLLAGGAHSSAPAVLQPGGLEALRAMRDAIPFGDAEADVLLAVKSAVEKEGFHPSDRTWIRCVKLVRAIAVVAGHDRVQPEDWRGLADVLWMKHTDRARLLVTVGNAADPYGARAEAILDGVHAAMRGLPEMSLLTSGQRRKTEMMSEVAKVSSRVSAELDKARDAADVAPDNATMRQALEAAEAAIVVIDKLNRDVLMYREQRA
jgi:MoxR-like ATPase